VNVLITGGTGFIGAFLARRRLAQGDKVVIFDVAPNTKRIADILTEVKVVQGNLANASEVYNTVRDNGIHKILHLGAMLSSPCEASPWAALQVNVLGTVNVLEAARLFGQPQVVYTSTISTFGLHTGATVTDTTVQHPTTMYGCGKAFVENLGRYYRSRFGVDFRCVRLSSVMGPGASSRQISQFNGIVQLPLSGKPFICSVTPDVKVHLFYCRSGEVPWADKPVVCSPWLVSIIHRAWSPFVFRSIGLLVFRRLLANLEPHCPATIREDRQGSLRVLNSTDGRGGD